MRKLVWGGIVACLVSGGLGVYLAVNRPWPVQTPASSDVEEQEAPPSVPYAVGAFTQNAPPSILCRSIDANEPIVVEGTTVEPPPPPEFGGEPVGHSNVYAIGRGYETPPRPDAEPGQETKMPYAVDQKAIELMATQLMEVLWRVFTGVPPETLTEETMPVETAEPPLPIIDHHYHDHEMCCPYTGRCVRPYYPVPPPAAPESK
jgi:hypothetical protein